MSDISAKLGSLLKKERGLLFAYAYGSFGRGEKDFSDIDIAVFVRRQPRNSAEYEAVLGRKLEKISGVPVDVRIINSLPLLLKSRILKEGKTIFSRDNVTRAGFEADIMCKYLDFNHHMKMFDRKRLERYGAG